MTLHLTEAAVTAVNTFLTVNMPVKIAALNAEYADSIVLKDIAIFSVEELVEAGKFPVIEVLGVEVEPTGEDGTYLKSKHSIDIACTVQEQRRAGELRRTVYRYARAIVELMVASRTSIGYVVTWGRPMIDYSPAFRVRNRAMAIAGCVVHVELQKTETKP